jgi:MFS family permease
MLGATVGVSTALGPLLGGVLIQLFGAHEGWRWVFYVNLPIGLVLLPLAHRLLPRHAAGRGERGARGSLDPVGVLLLGAGTVVLLLPFVQQREWPGTQKWLLLVPAVLVLAGFVGWERHHGRRREPLVDLALFRRRSYGLGTLLSLLYFAGFTAIFFVLTLFLQNGMRYSALEAGLSIMPFALGSGAAAAVGGRIVTRIGRPLVAGGLCMVVVGLLGATLAVQLDDNRSVGFAIALPLLFAGVGSGLTISPNQTLTLSEVPVDRAGSAGGVLQTAQRIGSAIGIAAVGSVFFATLVSSRGDFARGFEDGIELALAFVGATLVIAVLDVLVTRAKRPAAAGEARAAERVEAGAQPRSRDAGAR